jgi:crotonobetainyl-CoA:carnitine CoA-transferase CaiB-like acyl-CoA transferase
MTTYAGAAAMNAPLHGLKVIDQTQALAGPYAAMLLGDLGADVIKVERPRVGDNSRQWGPPFLKGESAYYLSLNRNKRGIALDISRPKGQAIIHELVREADVFLTNLMSNAALRRCGVDDATLRAINPRLIYASISGYGRRGPRADQPGYDLVAQAEGGTMALTGEIDGPPMRFPTAIADATCGLYAVIGILAALHARERSGAGQFLDMSLQDSQITWLQNYAAEYFATGEDPARRGNRHPQVVPYEAFQGADGDWFILAIGSDHIFESFCRLVGREALAQDERFKTNAQRVAHYETLLPIMREIIRTRAVDDWLDDLRRAGVPCGRIRTTAEALSDPHLLERGMIVQIEHPALGLLKSIATPIHLSQTPLAYYRHPPRLGEHTAEVLDALGIDRATQARLRAEGVIA